MKSMWIFGLIGTVLWLGVHVYVWGRLMVGVKERGWKWAGWGLGGVLMMLAPLGMGLGRMSGATSLPGLMWASNIYMGFFLLLFTFSVMRDVGLFGWGVWQKRRQKGEVDGERRRLLAAAVNVGVLGVTGGLSGVGYAEATKVAEVVEVEVPVKGLAPELDGLKIVQLSDLHIGPTIKGDYLRAVVERANAQQPDLVVVTGDLIDGYVNELAEDVRPLGGLGAPLGVYYVTGNHEYYWDAPGWEAFVSGLGVKVLSNRHEVVERGGAKLVIGGVTDFSAERFDEAWASNPVKALEGSPVDAFKILLAHQPKSVKAVAYTDADLMLSGHTHGGQFFPVNLFVGFAHPFSAGLHEVTERLQIYVSRGTGYWGPPLRLGAASEITVLRLKQVA